MNVFDDDEDEDLVADWDAFDAVVAQHQQRKQVGVPRQSMCCLQKRDSMLQTT
jgi:hypothetical protein